MSLMSKLKSAAAESDDPTGEAVVETAAEASQAPAITPIASKKKGLGLRPTFSEEEVAAASAPVSADAAESVPAQAAEPAQAPLDPNDPVSVLEAAMRARAVQFKQLTEAQRQDAANVRAWLDEHIHYWPVPPRAARQAEPNDVDRAAPQRPEDESTLATASRAAQLRSRRALRQRYMQESFALSNLVRFNAEDGACEYRFPTDNKVAFRERGEHLHFDDVNFNAIRCGIERAIELGWSSIRINGSDEFMSAAFIEATKAGLRIKDYDPTPEDLQKLATLGLKPVGSPQVQQVAANDIECGDELPPSGARESARRPSRTPGF